jgi:tRNA threonylcarbamoyl adenosine modification protein YeaZ
VTTPSVTALVFHHTSALVIVGIVQGQNIVIQSQIPYREASKELVVQVHKLLSTVSMTLSYLSYLACNIGPAPFTTLRTIVVTANGLAFASQRPMVGVNGLVCLAKDAHKAIYQRTYAIKNAFGSDVYCAVYDPKANYVDCQVLSTSEAMHSIMLYYSQNAYPKIQIVGQAADTFKQDLQEQGMVLDPVHAVEGPSFQGIAEAANTLWRNHMWINELVPYYGKTTLRV